MIRVLIKSSSPVVKAGLESLLHSYPQIEIIEEASEALEPDDDSLADLTPQPDVILVEANNYDTASEAMEHLPHDAPLILLVRAPATEWPDSLRQHARAVLPNTLTAPQIVAAIEAVAEGLGVFDPTDANQFHSPQIEIPNQLPEPLTPRETEILRAIAEGLGNKEIAARFGISENTVKFHVASVMGKLGAGSRTEAVMLGIRHGIVLI